MKLGLFLMPSHPPERGLKAGQEWDLEMIRTAAARKATRYSGLAELLNSKSTGA